jgi:hypothetical protein
LLGYTEVEQRDDEIAHYDLNTEGFNDTFVYLNDRDWCGSGGCTALVFKGTKSGCIFLSKTMIVNKSIYITQSSFYQ